MNDANNREHAQKHRTRQLIIPGAMLLLVLLLPGFLKLIVNRVVLPSKFSNPDVPLVSGTVDQLGYTGLTVKNMVIDVGNDRHLQIPHAEVKYTPLMLARKQLRSASATITYGPEIEIEAEVAARDVLYSSKGISAALSAQCSQVTTDRFIAGPFTMATQVDGTDAALAFEVPIQNGLLTAQIALDANWKTNPVFNAAATIPLRTKDGTAVQLGELVSSTDNVLVSGQAEVTVSGDADGVEATLSLAVSNLELMEHSLSLSNLYTTCTMRFPGERRSLPEQQLTVDQLSVGELQIDQLRMHYQMEPESVLFIEDLELNWCDGRVSLYNARLSPLTTLVAVQLFCDRLSLEQVLSACGLENFSAGGELNGRLPLLWNEQGLTIDRGFLFTTPGRGGTFAFGSSEIAAGILPPGSLEADQIGLVSAALEEFKYDWITMTLNSESEILKIVIEAAGQPANVLPYEYDAKRGTYVKIKLRPGRGTRQPMRFQLNLSVPLNQLLCYGANINRQWNLFKTNQ